MAQKKKKFWEVEIPLTNTRLDLLAYNIQDLDSKSIKLDLTRQLRGKSIEVMFKIKVEKEKAAAYPKKLTLLPFFIRRMLRKNISYVEDSFSADCSDGTLRIKPFLITRKRVSRAVRKTLREAAREWILEYIKTKNHEAIFSDIIGNRLQKPLSLKLKKIYPLALCEIRMLKIEQLREQEKLDIKVEKVKEKEPEEEKVEEKVEKKVEKEKEEKPKEEKKEEKPKKKTEKKVEKEKEEKPKEEKKEEKPKKKTEKKAEKPKKDNLSSLAQENSKRFSEPQKPKVSEEKKTRLSKEETKIEKKAKKETKKKEAKKEEKKK